MTDPLEVLETHIRATGDDPEVEQAALAALATLREQMERQEAALRRVRDHIGRGYADIVEANTALGRIDQEARRALSTEEPSEIPPQNWNTEKDHRKRDWPVREWPSEEPSE